MFQMVSSLTMAFRIIIIISTFFPITLTTHSLTSKQDNGHRFPHYISNIWKGRSFKKDELPTFAEMDKGCQVLPAPFADECTDEVLFAGCLVLKCGFTKKLMFTKSRKKMDNELKRVCCCIADKCIDKLTMETERMAFLERLKDLECNSCNKSGQENIGHINGPLNTSTTGEDELDEDDGKICDEGRYVTERRRRQCVATLTCLVQKCPFRSWKIYSNDIIERINQTKDHCCCALEHCQCHLNLNYLVVKYEECRRCSKSGQENTENTNSSLKTTTNDWKTDQCKSLEEEERDEGLLSDFHAPYPESFKCSETLRWAGVRCLYSNWGPRLQRINSIKEHCCCILEYCQGRLNLDHLRVKYEECRQCNTTAIIPGQGWDQWDQECGISRYSNEDSCKAFGRCIVSKCGFDKETLLYDWGTKRGDEWKRHCCCILDKCEEGLKHYYESWKCKRCETSSQEGITSSTNTTTTTTATITDSTITSATNTTTMTTQVNNGGHSEYTTALLVTNTTSTTTSATTAITTTTTTQVNNGGHSEYTTASLLTTTTHMKTESESNTNDHPKNTNAGSRTKELIRQEAICWRDKCKFDMRKANKKDGQSELDRICCCAMSACKSHERRELKYLFEECNCTGHFILGLVILVIIACSALLICILAIVLFSDLLRR